VITLAAYCGLVFLASWLGGMLPSLLKLTHTRLQGLISLIGGLMLGVGLLHQLPHAVTALAGAQVRAPLDLGVLWMLVGLTTMFFLLRMFHFHQHDTFDEAPDHDHDCRHDHDQDHGQLPTAAAAQSWIGLAFGLAVHTLSDGLALASHVEADIGHNPTAWLPGLGTFLGIVLHKPLDSLSITSLMRAGGASAWLRTMVNIGYAMLCPAGALLFQFGMRSLTTQQGLVVGAALAFSAGAFVCIALSDLLPEVQFHSHDRLWLSLALTGGLVLSWLIGFAEPEHSHGTRHEHPPAAHAHEHRHPH